MKKALVFLAILTSPLAARPVADEPAVEKPTRWEVSLETAQMIGLRNPNNYYFSTQMLNLAWEPFSSIRVGGIPVRVQLLATFFASAILSGPESYYLGGGPQLRVIVPLGESRWSIYANGGGGFGAADANEADKLDRGLGQDFTFLLLAAGGVRYAVNDRWTIWLGGMWHHLSNNDLSEPDKRNTGLDAVGVVLGGGFAF